ncbi:MAG: hypothetical protein K2F69_02115 [Bacteroidaceae bacterium]|nr:hypothetical protein [Bacteroidaceae bacterium]
MKQKTFLLMCIGICAISASIKIQSVKSASNSSLLIANVEALSDEEEAPVKMQDCTRIKISGSCYQKEDGMWRGTYIDAVEHYQVPVGSPLICYHYSVHGCPSGTERR